MDNTGAFFRQVIGLALILLVGQSSLAGDRAAFDLAEVFEYRLKTPDERSYAALDPSGELIYLLEGRMLKVVDWRSQTTVASASYSDLPCTWENVTFHGWYFLPDQSEIIAVYCTSLFVIDAKTLAVKAQLIQSPPDNVDGVAVSPNGKTIAVMVFRPESKESKYQVLLFATGTWNLIARWPVELHALTFHRDGNLLALWRERRDSRGRVSQCGVDLREVPTGEVYSEWWIEVDNLYTECPTWPEVEPSSRILVATAFDNMSGRGIHIWDVETGKLVRKIESERPVHGLLFSPNSDWVIGDVSNDPEDTPKYSQDFIVWDASSGEILYQSQRHEWTVWDKLGYLLGTNGSWVERSSLQLIGISDDGRYLLVTKPGKIVLYDVKVSKENVAHKPQAASH